jgi:hypothetical protein
MTPVMSSHYQDADAALAELDEALAVAAWVTHWVRQFDELVPLNFQKTEVNDGPRTSTGVCR